MRDASSSYARNFILEIIEALKEQDIDMVNLNYRSLSTSLNYWFGRVTTSLFVCATIVLP